MLPSFINLVLHSNITKNNTKITIAQTKHTFFEIDRLS